MTDDEDGAPPAVPEWEPSELARRIPSGHGAEHFPDVTSDDLARIIQRTIDVGAVRAYFNRTLYWDRVSQVAVIENPRDRDGGTAFPSDETYFEKWGS